MTPKNTTTPRLFFADLPNAGEARKAAERLAEKLAETSGPGRRETVVVTDEDGNVSANTGSGEQTRAWVPPRMGCGPKQSAALKSSGHPRVAIPRSGNTHCFLRAVAPGKLRVTNGNDC
jgi:hypothetical protein